MAVRPSMLDLVRLSPRPLLPPGGQPLYRQIALLADVSEGDELLDVGAGDGTPVEFFIREHGVVGYGVESDQELVSAAEARTRGLERSDRFHFQHGMSDDLPYRDGIFDVVVAELGFAADCEPAPAVRELCRVAKPGAPVVLVQLVWTAPVEKERREVLSEHLGARPLMLVEWKKLLRDAGVESIHTEDWSDAETAFRAHAVKPFPDFAELFSIPEKLGIYRRAWSRWGWAGVREAIARQREVHRLLTRERILALYLIKGVRSGGEETLEAASPPQVEQELASDDGGHERPPEKAREEPPSGDEPERAAHEDVVEDAAHEDGAEESLPEEVDGLPLFGRVPPSRP